MATIKTEGITKMRGVKGAFYFVMGALWGSSLWYTFAMKPVETWRGWEIAIGAFSVMMAVGGTLVIIVRVLFWFLDHWGEME